MWVLRHVFREQNRTTDCMAKEEAARLGNFGDLKVFMSPPNFVQNQLYLDSVKTVYPRKLASNDSYVGQDMAYG